MRALFLLLFLCPSTIFTVKPVDLKASTLESPSSEFFPDLPFRFPDGVPFTIRSYRGRVILINIFSSTCKPCLEELPSLNRLAKKGEGYPFQVVGLCADIGDPEKLKDFLIRKKIRFPVAYAFTSNPFSSLIIRGYPTTFLLDPSGRILRRFEGPRRWDAPEWWELFLSLFPTR